MGIENLKLRKIYKELQEDYEERLSNASKIMAHWLMRLYTEKKLTKRRENRYLIISIRFIHACIKN